jgi:hypothetical protein
MEMADETAGSLASFGTATFLRLLWLDGAVLVDPAASEESVMHHAQPKHKNQDCEGD